MYQVIQLASLPKMRGARGKDGDRYLNIGTASPSNEETWAKQYEYGFTQEVNIH